METQGNDLAVLRETLEEEELNSPNGVAPILTYKKLLLIYLVETDLTNAKFLWKRMPLELKNDNEMSAIWKIGQSLWKREFSNIYSVVRSMDWSEDLKGLIELFCEMLRKRLVKLVEESYSIIKFDDLCKFLGIAEEQLVEIAATNSWTLDTENRLVKISQSDNKLIQASGSEGNSAELLHRLTQYVSFLEN